ncbi:hypothetical protein LTR35_009156 [Friedmanniomyces endolithicus]|uniref:FAD-binding domain-containing protein n=1 Tax=Friedmanniomyces endolithicus TaxID=329885 RepID=A0AAN6JDB3_9PEZI|nr:hypothetical protein LTR35_009156 [Friedmanniomyces endolithicus]KAK0292215.1 hypothetical protein LTS00_008050 [Friedmanniomyces endolithicus]KAK0320209.1 hypothetical protein LTR82_008726 [Friedmanniomyces endolithicus]KAK0986312.1 hypothetical protein LTR54_013483 [Friedmanniomyces endolithicus]
MESSTPPALSLLDGKRIAVVGAGIAGLSFVVSLRRSWTKDLGVFPEVVHYEREENMPDESHERYSVRIRGAGSSAGAHALRKMKILETTINSGITRPGFARGHTHGYITVKSLDWLRLVSLRDGTRGSPLDADFRIGRLRLRQILHKVASEYGKVNWGSVCSGVTSQQDGRLCLSFDDGKKDVCDFLVVADGANSKIRKYLRPQDNLSFAGPINISVVSRFAESAPPLLNRDWGIVASGNGTALFTCPVDKTTVHWSLSYMANEPGDLPRRPISPELSAQILREAQDMGTAFGDPFRVLVDNSDPTTVRVFNSNDKEPFAHGPANNLPRGVIFIGDSNHAVTPFAGSGANMALLDGHDLAECLCMHRSIDEATKAYDQRSLPRARRLLKNSHYTIAVAHAAGWRWLLISLVLQLFGMLKLLWAQLESS